MVYKVKNKYLYNGEMLSIVELMPFSIVSKPCLTGRLVNGWDVDLALSTKTRAKGINACVSKRDVDLDISQKLKKDKENFDEYAGFAQCSRRCNAK